MLSSALVVFREVFEIALIVGIVLAATAGIPQRNKAIYIGFAGGLLGSLLVAFFTGKISSMADGLGQEYFNAGILFTAAVFIGWTLIWMKKHAREMKAHFSRVGHAVAEGKLPFLSLSVIIALAVLREGAEIALFTYGMLATGQSATSLAIGSLIGFAGGAVIGILFYLGLIKLSTRIFFQVTSWMLVFLVAGMASQAIGFLTAAGAFESLSFIVWDSSWLLTEHGFIGGSLKALLGYTAQPSAIQLITYALTLGVFIMLMRLIDSKQKLNMQAVTTTALILFVAGSMLIPSHPAYATQKVYSPYVEKGELELEWRGGYDIDDEDDVDGAWKQKLAIGYGFTDFWFSEIYGEVEKEGDDDADAEFSAMEWENKFQLTQPGEYWLDVGALVELEYNTSGGADKAEGKLLLAKETGKFTHMVNLVAEREFGEDAENETETGLSWSTRYRYRPEFEPGFEIHSEFGELGESSSFDEQEHQIGPVFYGKIGPVKYDVGYLFGVSDAAPDGSIKALLEYEWHF
jgi:high-affinity iron transporter